MEISSGLFFSMEYLGGVLRCQHIRGIQVRCVFRGGRLDIHAVENSARESCRFRVPHRSITLAAIVLHLHMSISRGLWR